MRHLLLFGLIICLPRWFLWLCGYHIGLWTILQQPQLWHVNWPTDKRLGVEYAVSNRATAISVFHLFIIPIVWAINCVSLRSVCDCPCWFCAEGDEWRGFFSEARYCLTRTHRLQSSNSRHRTHKMQSSDSRRRTLWKEPHYCLTQILNQWENNLSRRDAPLHGFL